jgi:hypothetical protein
MNNVIVTSALLALLASASAACGGATPEPATTPTSSAKEEHHGDHKGDHKGDHHKDLPAPVHAFHEVLAPLWHLEKGPDRTAKTCAQVATLREKATATADKELLAATTALAAECDKAGRPDFDARFSAVHERFHKLAE